MADGTSGDRDQSATAVSPLPKRASREDGANSYSEEGVGGRTVWSGERASTYRPNEILEGSRPVDFNIGGFLSYARTEYADSSKGKDGATGLLRTPLLPKDSLRVRAEYNQHFECPYCWRPQKVQDKTEWKQVKAGSTSESSNFETESTSSAIRDRMSVLSKIVDSNTCSKVKTNGVSMRCVSTENSGSANTVKNLLPDLGRISNNT